MSTPGEKCVAFVKLCWNSRQCHHRLGRAPDTAAPEVDPMDELGDFNEPALQNNKKRKGKNIPS